MSKIKSIKSAKSARENNRQRIKKEKTLRLCAFARLKKKENKTFANIA
ncbi:MAG: hypothetical protein ACN6OI_09060 [Flavobacterium sp.]|nr:hypothetical protein [Flavobacterium sp. ACN2]